VVPRSCLDAMAKRNIHFPYRELNPDPVARILVSVLNELSLSALSTIGQFIN
jgi:hypothetical protein